MFSSAFLITRATPTAGRFVQAGDVRGWDRYAYVENNPLRYADPSGHCPVCMLFVLAILTTGCAARQDTQPLPILDTAVNITDSNGNHVSNGTIINKDTVLTHNHQMSPLNSYNAKDAAGNIIPWAGAMSDPVGQDVVINGINLGAQTRLVTFLQPPMGAEALIASPKTIMGLRVGDLVDIVYWDDANNNFALGQFSVSNVDNLRNGGISVDDPHNLLNPGDSGSGVFLNGELIGSLWAIDLTGRTGHIALIPPRASKNSRAITWVK